MTSGVSAQLKAKLRKAREKFIKAEPAESNTAANRKVPDGTYTAKVVGLEFAEFGKHPVIRFTFEVTDADKKTQEVAIGQLVETRFNLDTDEGPSFIKRDFGKFGYDDVNDLLDDPDATTQLFTELLGLNPIVKISVAMDDSDQWQNVYLNDVLEMDEDQEEVKEEPKKEVASGKKKKTKAPEPVDETPDEETPDEDDGGEEAEESTEEVEEEESESDESSEERELEIGDIVEVEYKGKDVGAKVISIDEKNSTVKVEIKNKRVIVPLEKVYLLEG